MQINMQLTNKSESFYYQFGINPIFMEDNEEIKLDPTSFGLPANFDIEKLGSQIREEK